VDVPKQLMLRISAVACVIFGAFRLLLSSYPLISGYVGEEVRGVYFVFLVVASAWQLFAGIFGLMYWKQPEKISIIAKIAVIMFIFDGIFFAVGIMIGHEISVLDTAMGLLMLSFPTTILYIVAASKLKKKADATASRAGRIFKNIIILLTAFAAGIVMLFIMTIGTWLVFIMQENIPLEDAIPLGTWESSNPPIILHIHPEYRMSVQSSFTYPAIYRAQDGDNKIFVEFNTRNSMLGRYRSHVMGIFCRHDSRFSWYRMRGDFRVVRGQLHLSTHTEDLIFDRIEDYEFIELDEWRRLSGRY